MKLVVFAMGALLLLGGMVLVVARELSTAERRRVTHRWRDAVEVLLPMVGAIVLIVFTWRAL